MEEKTPYQEKQFYDQYREYFDLNEKLLGVVDRVLQSKVIKHDNDPLKMTAIYFMTKAIKTNRAVWHLCADGYGEDAAILIRSLFNLIINFYFILSQDTENRAKRFIYHSAYTKYESYKIMSKWADVFKQLDLQTFNASEIQKEAENAQKQYKFEANKPWSNKTILQMAKDIDAHSSPKNNSMEKNYDVVYNFLSDFEHSNVMSANSYIKDDENGWYPQINPTDNLIPETLASDTGYLLMIFEQFCNIFQLDAKKDIKDLCAELENLKNMPPKKT